MAEPANTPMPPGTPISSTPRSASPSAPTIPISMPPPPLPAALASSPSRPSPSLCVPTRPIVLHIGDPIKYNPSTYTTFSRSFDVVRPPSPQRQRPEFIRALKERRWGDFDAIFRPFWGSGGEMGNWDAELIALLPKSCRVFASAGAGFDWADVKALGESGIVYCNGGLAAAEAVADFAVALVISTFRALPYCMYSAQTAQKFKECHELATARSRNLRGRALGLVGFGNIGQQIAARCGVAFSMNILYYDIERKGCSVEEKLQARYCASLEELCRGSDCVVLCTPSGAGKLINSQSLCWFKADARLVNIARGALVDEDALADALEAGRLSSVALDVHVDEPNVHPRLAAMAGDRVILTCHNAGGTVETHIGFEELAMRNIMAVLAGGQAITPVNLQWMERST